MLAPVMIKLGKKPFQRVQKWLWATLLIGSFCLAVGLSGQPVAAYSQSFSQPSLLSQTHSATPAEKQTTLLNTPLNQEIADGVEAFDSGRFVAALAHWQTALDTLDPGENLEGNDFSQNDLVRAYLLSNLAAAYQQLGQFSNASLAVQRSRALVPVEAPANQSQTQAYWQVSARTLNSEGQLLWQQGEKAAALALWQQAETHYRTANVATLSTGLILTQIILAIALQSLGLNVRSVQRLTQLETQLSGLPPNFRGVATKELGKALRRVGELSKSQAVLSGALTAIRADGETGETLVSQLELELGHTLRSLSHQAVDVGHVELAKDYQTQTLRHYSTALSTAALSTDRSESLPALSALAQLNQLSYLIETAQLEAAQLLAPQIEISMLAPGRDRVEAYISYAHSLVCIQVPTSADCIRMGWQEVLASETARETVTARETDQPQWNLIAQSLAEAIRQAKDLSDPLLESYAVGELGHVYELSGQQGEALELTQRALGLLEGTQLQEAAYRWEWQLGRLYRSQPSDPAAAYAAYQQAIESLATVRQNLSLVNPQLQLSFRDNVEPLYREFVTLLLGQRANGQKIDQRSLRLAVETIDELQITELENFLGCQLSQLVNLSDVSVDSRAAKIYPILLAEQLAIIVDIPNQPLQLRTVAVARQTVESTLRALRRNLALPGKTPEVLTSASQLYQWLFAPIAPILAAAEQIETLVFVPDGAFRNVPIGVLYDGSQYLIEKEYAIAIAPQLDLFAPRDTPQQLRILRGGLGLAQTIEGRRFPAIELVQAELEQIPDELTVGPALLNEAFTQPNIEQQLANERYSAIHWKTHGILSSDPAGTFLVAYKDDITANELSSLVHTARVQQAEPLELLVLSACETAQGDRRAVLGLAGIAVRVGARSTLSTLWRADDRANTQLTTAFYQGISAGLTKAQALQQAQQALLAVNGYPAPYYWAPYVLVGNWL